ncbi:MAG: YceI family protein, partial [Bdellovibrionales bacterium]|nr:YceI family protein [Bdellovibrionales bacterium]
QFDNRRSGNALEQEVLTYLSTIGFSPTKVESMLGCNSISSRKIHRGSDGLIYVGDALERFDPVGGLGMSHGLCSAAHAAKVIVESRAFESDLSVKARFERKRAFDAFVFRIITGGCYKLIVEQSSFLGVVSKFAPSVSFKFIEFLKGLVSVPSIGNVTLVKSGHLIDFRTSVFRRINVMQPRYTMFASVFLFITLFLTSGVIHASTPTEDDSSSNDKSTWYLPSGLTDSNTTVEFNVDSTWHMVEGKTAGVEGSAKLADNSDPRTLVVEVKLPVAKFDTDSSKRDREMRDVMAEKEFPFVSFESTSPLAQCVPAIVLRDGSCEDILKGVLQIRDVKKDILIPIVISNIGDSFEVTGAIPVKWAEFGVEDPSIFIARLDSTVNVNFKVVLKAATLVQAS